MPQRLAECLPCTEANPEANPEADGDSGPAPERKPAQVCFLSLPTELHLVIAELLIYPDALSLKHTNRHFYGLVDTGIELKVDWLMERRRMHLECPNDKRCDLGSDLRFCRGSVPLLMRRRREHVECESLPGLGCLVHGTPACAHRPTRRGLWRYGVRINLTIELWWLLPAMMAVVIACLLAKQASSLVPFQ
ncbi:hypothetical protein RJ55_06439 [Drechmeria coniospora]|nr:hypothetical protein RJ55_06439 [Drechmeria coniospora]